MDDAATYWYHPHLHMKTMKQVLKGASGMIIQRDAVEGALNLPRTYGVDDFPLVCQWKTFDIVTKQIVMDDELDNATMVNGTLNGYLNVPAQMVRLRLLNGRR
jgi:bilirubin oxidase